MPKVPISGYQMFEGTTGLNATSIYEAVAHMYGTPAGTDFASIIAQVQANGVLGHFDARYRPVSLADLNESDHFRNFPTISACLTYGSNQYDVCCGQHTPCPDPPPDPSEGEIDEPWEADPVILTAGISANDVCCNLLLL